METRYWRTRTILSRFSPYRLYISTPSGDAAVVEDDDAVAEFAAAHAVGDVDGGFAGSHLAELFVDFGFGDGVEGGGRLVEDDERGILVEGAGDSGALGLAAGEVDTRAVVVVKAGADALRELLYTVGETDFCKRGLQSSFINRSPCGDVLVERKGEQVEILENHGEGLGVLFVIVFADVDAV